MNTRAAKFVQNLRGLTLSEKVVAQGMAVHADYDNAEAYMSMGLLAAESGIKNRETASRIVSRLEKTYGIIETVDGAHSEGGRGKTTTFRFTFAVNCDSPVTLTSAEEERKRHKTVTEPRETVTPQSHLARETVTQNAETVTPQSHEGFKVFLTPPASSLDGTSPEGEMERRARKRGEAPRNNNTRVDVGGLVGQENLTPASRQFNAETHADDLVRETEMRQVERRMTVNQIYQEFKITFDRLKRGLIIRLTWKAPTFAHKKAAADLYRSVGGSNALAAWEKFLVDGYDDDSLDVSQADKDEEGKVIASYTVQRDWLLQHFVDECGNSLRKENQNA